jgi:hypothetical protein
MAKQKQEITPERINDLASKLISARKQLENQKEFVMQQKQKLEAYQAQLDAAQKDYDAMIESLR